MVLGNHKDQVWSKSDHYAPVLCGDSLCFLASLAVEKCRPLQQGDCKNAFCQGILPPDETTIVQPPFLRLLQMNAGCYFPPSMVFGAVHNIGMIKSMQSSGRLVSPPCLKILVFTPALSKIRRTRLAHNHQAHSPLVSTLMTLSISLKTLPLKPSSVIFWPNDARWISWALSSGS